ncbi:hypothetical protein niasHT_034510 [Heterodera trifolii]|uniref:Cytochrome c oxidase assembly protein COX11, mitochondrial n=1 Tax=Heterodera trifolii TaxID=157864 RepID=A0ABD2J3M8_9BILA
MAWRSDGLGRVPTAGAQMACSKPIPFGLGDVITGPILLTNRTVSFYTLFNRRRSPPSLHLMTDRQRRIDEAFRGLGWVFIMVGVTFAALPLYRMFCESTGFGGTTNVAKALEHIEQMNTVPERLIRVRFNADVNSSMQWKFKPVQNEIYVNPGETALAFFTAENPSDRPIVGISTYNLTPFQAAYYFNKTSGLELSFCQPNTLPLGHETTCQKKDNCQLYAAKMMTSPLRRSSGSELLVCHQPSTLPLGHETTCQKRDNCPLYAAKMMTSPLRGASGLELLVCHQPNTLPLCHETTCQKKDNCQLYAAKMMTSPLRGPQASGLELLVCHQPNTSWRSDGLQQANTFWLG